MSRRQIVVYGDINLNIIDGSAAWLVSLAETLSLTDSTVHVVLKAAITTDRLLTRIVGLPNVEVHAAAPDTGFEAMSIPRAVTHLEEVVASTGASVVIVRGRELADAASQSSLSPILWSYVTDYAFPSTLLPPAQLAQLRRIAGNSRRVFMQTEEARSYFESIVPEAAGKTLLMTPTVPDDFFVDRTTRDDGPVRLVYAGKLHPDWRTLEMLDLPKILSERGISASLTLLGDKISAPEPTWTDAMRAGLEAPDPLVTWGGGMPREEAVAEVARADIGLSWRSDALDSSLEVSTKMLEYAASGTPPLLNRTAAHEDLFGTDYPLFVEHDDANHVAHVIADALEGLDETAAKAQAVARRYSSSSTAERLESYFRRTEPDLLSFPKRAEPLRVVLASYDFKFAGELVDTLLQRPDIELRFDRWTRANEHDEAESQRLLDWADVVICEWAAMNAVWYSHHIRPDQRLLVRLHRYELTTSWVAEMDISRVDHVITVSSYFRDEVLRATAWAPNKVTVIPNGLDALDLNRPKRRSAKHSLALIGFFPLLKRPDRAVDLLEALLERDERFTLTLRGRMPWEWPWEWRRPSVQEAYLALFDRIGSSPALREHVIFEGFGPDMSNALRGFGWVLSPSSLESFHLAPAEGMASGSIPVLWPRTGVREIFGDDNVFGSIPQAVEYIVETTNDPQRWAEEAQKAQRIASQFDTASVGSRWLNLIFRDAETTSDS